MGYPHDEHLRERFGLAVICGDGWLFRSLKQTIFLWEKTIDEIKLNSDVFIFLKENTIPKLDISGTERERERDQMHFFAVFFSFYVSFNWTALTGNFGYSTFGDFGCPILPDMSKNMSEDLRPKQQILSW